MGVSESVIQGRRFVVDRPGVVVVAVFTAVLIVDLGLKLLGVGFSLFGGTLPVVEVGLPVLYLGGELPVGRLAGFVWNGLVVGLVIGLASIGLSLTYSILNFANFAHGDYLTAGAFSGWAVAYLIAGFGAIDAVSLVLLRAPPGDVGASIWTSPVAVVFGLLASIAATILVALALDRVVYRPMRDADGISLLIASIGVAFALRYFIALVFGNSRRIVPSGDNLPSVVLGGVIVDLHEVTLVVVAVALMLGMHVLLQETRLGKAMRAMADNRDLARISGIPTERVVRSTWMLGAGLTGAAGFLLVLSQAGLGFTTGWRLLLLIFAAVIMGGIGSVYGAIAGGIIIGLASRVSMVWLQGDFAAFTDPAAFSLMILILLFRPSGIFGGVETA
ncbi:branched-chain amino acid ABC transporter permease [Halobacterium zhouii]|uniref:branched-chain amino acid ABC transporter permease n=1 Tax=Halobacterium zhouii TaxID=2902624 RepID=UPI001E369A53|nr:branched-chain amino acid ABC transporter permease [Halobacterium zhouii]